MNNKEEKNHTFLYFYLDNSTLAYLSVFCDSYVPLLPGYYVILIVILGGLCHPSHKSTKSY